MAIINLYQFKAMCLEMAELGAANYAKIISPAKDLILQRNAYKDFGEARVKRWVHQGLIKTIRSGETSKSKVLYSRAELTGVKTANKLDSIVNI